MFKRAIEQMQTAIPGVVDMKTHRQKSLPLPLPLPLKEKKEEEKIIKKKSIFEGLE